MSPTRDVLVIIICLIRSSFYSEDVMFPPTIVGEPVYQTVVIRNAGKEPTIFGVKEDSSK